MSEYTLTNAILTAKFRSRGGEMISLVKNETAREYLWNGDPSHWRFSSPVLFPFVGKTKNCTYSYDGQIYSMKQHGFAREMEFQLKSQSETEIWFSLPSTPDLKENYPFSFVLELGYQLREGSVRVTWRVINKDTKTMYFSIGGHPAFSCPPNPSQERSSCYLGFSTEKEYLKYRLIHPSQGLVEKPAYQLSLENGMHPIEPSMFDKDALIFEGNQVQEVYLADAHKKPYLSIRFDAPLFGLWSPSRKAPFVCIEPWYGRCDAVDFEGTLEEREWGNRLEAGGCFERGYRIDIL